MGKVFAFQSTNFWTCSAEDFAESNITSHYKTLRISIGLVKTYGQRFFSKNDGALSYFALSKTCFLEHKTMTYDGYGEINGELF